MSKILADPRRALNDRRLCCESACRRWLEHASERRHFDVSEAKKLAIFGVRLARRVVLWQGLTGAQNRCLLARAFAVLGWNYCEAGDLKKASHALDKAADLASRCLDHEDRSNIHMRRALLRAHQAQRPDGSFDLAIIESGLELAELALREARSPISEARALNARGHLQVFAGKPRKGAQDAKRSLELVADPEAHLFVHLSAISLLIWALSFGEKADREEAIAHLEKLRAALPDRAPALRARLLWAEALIYAQDPRRKPRARHRLDQARRKFVKLKMQAEAIAVTADQARIDPMGPIGKLCAELLAILDPSPIRARVEALRSAHVMARRDLAEQLRQTIRAPGLLPVPAWPGR